MYETLFFNIIFDIIFFNIYSISISSGRGPMFDPPILTSVTALLFTVRLNIWLQYNV